LLLTIQTIINTKLSKTMLEYMKMILQKVSFDAGLFSKELHKAERFLSKEECYELYHWTKMNFQHVIENHSDLFTDFKHILF